MGEAFADGRDVRIFSTMRTWLNEWIVLCACETKPGQHIHSTTAHDNRLRWV